ncbi:unnamed protein product [Leptosia nina]|uniref:Ionotropic receptor n=1 Tax=Leptosia nina TaxID=320188 RepID=A0AAV1JEK6_9NEOP
MFLLRYLELLEVEDLYLGLGEHSTASALYFGDIDIAPVLRYTTQHAGYYDVIHPHVTYAAGGYFYRIPTTGVGKFENQFLTPFTGTVWLCVVVVIALCGVGLVLGASFEDRPQAGRYAFFSVVALTCQQFFEDVDESAVKRNSTARKLTILVTGLSCVLIFNYYTSSVVSWLLNGPPPSINSLWELMNSPLEPIFMDVGYTWSWLQSPNYYFNVRDAKAEDVLKKKVKKKGPHLVSTPTQGIELVHKGGYVLYCDTDTANKYIALTFSARELCDVGRLPGLEKIPMYSCVQKNSPYREFFIWSFARMAEQGIIKLIQTRTYPPEIRCEGSTPRALALGGAAPAFIILAFGYIMGTLFMVMERIIKVHKDKKMMKVKYFE